jgi:GNAT superfamily N-acetyltransferase
VVWQLRNANEHDLASLVPLLDEHFVFGKGRTHSLATRFPHLYGSTSDGAVTLLESAAGVASLLACHPFNWRAAGQTWQGAMIGGVYTVPAFRGSGCASMLLRRTIDRLQCQGADFAVLWAEQAGFYSRLGWQLSDPFSLLGEGGAERIDELAIQHVHVRHLDTSLQAEIESIRSEYPQRSQVIRRKQSYDVVPLPATEIDVCLWQQEARRCYAMVGRVGDAKVVYEICGDLSGMAAIWAAINAATPGKLLVNESAGSPVHRWLVDHASLTWTPKPLTMWLPISDAFRQRFQDAAGYIPYFDRI